MSRLRFENKVKTQGPHCCAYQLLYCTHVVGYGSRRGKNKIYGDDWTLLTPYRSDT